ncbi:MAG: ATP-binding protein [Pseudomonadota bacterium]|nr:ATP-binding protein [Pseudomonadota bacterium]
MPADPAPMTAPSPPRTTGCGPGPQPQAQPQTQPGQITLPTAPEKVRAALADLRRRLSPLGFEEEELGSVELVTAEALNNIVEHAHGGNSHGQIRLTWDFGATGLLIRIEDDGTPMPDGRMPLMDHAGAPEPPAHLPDLPEGGFGWFLITALARNVQYRRERDLNVLTYRLAVGLVGQG